MDLHLNCGTKYAIIEVKSFKTLAKTELAQQQAAHYAKRLSLNQVTIALFVPVEDEDVLNELSGQRIIDGVKVFVSAIGWV